MKTNIISQGIETEETAEYIKITTKANGFKVSSIFPKHCPDGEKNLDTFIKELNRVVRNGS